MQQESCRVEMPAGLLLKGSPLKQEGGPRQHLGPGGILGRDFLVRVCCDPEGQETEDAKPLPCLQGVLKPCTKIPLERMQGQRRGSPHLYIRAAVFLCLTLGDPEAFI